MSFARGMCRPHIRIMYSSCLFCHHPLGANEMVEAFPVGRRLAFDAAKGRLWVVCTSCERWNLTPLEERWEAVEQAEHLYRDTKLRVATENIGLARLADGTGLVGLDDRVATAGGELRVESPRGGGTLVAADLPLPV